MTNDDASVRGLVVYGRILRLLTFAYVVCVLALLYLNDYLSCPSWFPCVWLFPAGDCLPPSRLFVLQLAFWGALGGTIASSLFLAKDKEMNEVEATKTPPDPAKLRYPDAVDYCLYLHRVLTSAVLAVIGFFVARAGVGFFDGEPDLEKTKHRAFFIALVFMIGLYQFQFLDFLKERLEDLLRPKKTDPPSVPNPPSSANLSGASGK